MGFEIHHEFLSRVSESQTSRLVITSRRFSSWSISCRPPILLMSTPQISPEIWVDPASAFGRSIRAGVSELRANWTEPARSPTSSRKLLGWKLSGAWVFPLAQYSQTALLCVPYLLAPICSLPVRSCWKPGSYRIESHTGSIFSCWRETISFPAARENRRCKKR